MDPKQVIREGYDALGARFSEWIRRNPPAVRSWFLDEVVSRIAAGGDVLELGCGPGTAAERLADGRRYTGVDLSFEQLSIARTQLPGGRFIQADFTSLDFPADTFDAVVAFYVFNHVPRPQQAPTFAKVFRWLRPGGRFMLSLGVGGSADEIQEDWLGVPMFFASFDRATNDRLLAEAGFEIELSETRSEIEEGEGEVTFHWVIARRPAG